MKPLKFPFIANLALALVSIICIGYLLKLGEVILAPFFLAFLFAMLFLPLADTLEDKLRFPRSLSTVTSVLILVGTLSGLIYLLGNQLTGFKDDLPQLSTRSDEVYRDVQLWISHTFQLDIHTQFQYLNQGMTKLLSSSGTILTTTFSAISNVLMFLGFFLLFFIFILNYRSILNRFIIDVFPERYKRKVVAVVMEIQSMTKNYILGVCLQVILVFMMSAIVLSVLGVKYAILLAVITGLLNVIPYLGIIVSLLIALFITFVTSAPITCLYVALGYIGIHAIDGNIIVPFVVGSKVKINALFSFIGIVIGEQLWGIPGMFLCIPALAIIRIVFERIETIYPWGALLGEEKRIKKKRRKKKTPPADTPPAPLPEPSD